MSSTTPSNRSSRRLGRAGSAAAAAIVLSAAVGVGIVSASASATAPVSVSAMGHNPHQPAEGYGASPSAPGSSHTGHHRG
ncbi:hypothetical protein [Clavibacter capsici]|uniref:Uncharacterized protein n=1 Tax=Clavibacter capsici TaxID=1874630 RepID=A0A0M5JZ03_9MICO|nr:hypothetical protein [Clavibacter capsici]ALD11684.1 hypothetical protein AES38_00775 [Clavibacter capsici]QIS38051.1 hypothetical protein GW572_00800 [Clavibacter capsici]QIS40796.1 hypothetical protein GW571_00790 [Clavibacter capsici]QIS43738.1 hypothetical protein GW570_00780 [Clavibacter capsici]